MPGVAQQQGAQVLEAGPPQVRDAGVVAARPGGGERARRGARRGGARARAVRADAQFHRPGAARWQLGLPAQQARGGEGVGRRRVGRDGAGALRGVPAQAGGVDVGRELRARFAGGHRGQFREVRAEGRLDRHPQGSHGGAAQGDPFRAVRVPDPFDQDIGVRSGGGGRTDGSHEAGPVGGDRPRLHRERFAPGHPQPAPGEQPPARAVEALHAPAGQLPVLPGDDQPRQGHAHQGGVHRGRPRRCGSGHGAPGTERGVSGVARNFPGAYRRIPGAGRDRHGRDACGRDRHERGRRARVRDARARSAPLRRPERRRLVRYGSAVVRRGGVGKVRGRLGHAAASSAPGARPGASGSGWVLRSVGGGVSARPGSGFRHTGERNGPARGHALVAGNER